MSDEFITPEKFCDAWKKVWAAKWSVEQKVILETFGCKSEKGWTGYMLTDENSFLACVAGELGFQQDYTKTNYYQVEYQRFDMALMSDWDEGYPYHLDAVIEHENGKHPEDEMWKLMLLRSPLKVIVCYFHEPEEKLKLCWEMLDKANAAFPENKNTKYLFIIGSINEKGDKMRWRWATDKEHLPQNLC